MTTKNVVADELRAVLEAIVTRGEGAEARCATEVLALLARPDPLDKQFAVSLAELVDLYDEPPSATAAELAPAIGAIGLPLIAARATIIAGRVRDKAKEKVNALALYDEALQLLGDDWSRDAQDLWGFAMQQRVRHARFLGDALEAVDTLATRAADVHNSYLSNRVLEASAAWMHRAATADRKAETIAVCRRALACEIAEATALTWSHRIDLGCGLALALRQLDKHDDALAACREVLALQAHVTTDNQRANFSWALAEGAYIATEIFEQPSAALPFIAAIRALIDKPRNDDERVELAYGVVMEARCAFMLGDDVRTTKLLTELDKITDGAGNMTHALAAETLLRGDLAAKRGDRHGAIELWKELAKRHGTSKDDSLRECSKKASDRLAELD
ncbi:MAG: hypothetical protein ABI467_20175 [Kofleriaceae bacterium]